MQVQTWAIHDIFKDGAVSNKNIENRIQWPDSIRKKATRFIVFGKGLTHFHLCICTLHQLLIIRDARPECLYFFLFNIMDVLILPFFIVSCRKTARWLIILLANTIFYDVVEMSAASLSLSLSVCLHHSSRWCSYDNKSHSMNFNMPILRRGLNVSMASIREQKSTDYFGRNLTPWTFRRTYAKVAREKTLRWCTLHRSAFKNAGWYLL